MFRFADAGMTLIRSLAIAAMAMLAAPADAAPIQLVKIFNTPLVGSAPFDYTIQTKALGIWIEIPCIDDFGSCHYDFTDIAAGTTVVLADSDLHSWFRGGSFFVREEAPPAWSAYPRHWRCRHAAATWCWWINRLWDGRLGLIPPPMWERGRAYASALGAAERLRPRA